MIVEMNKLTLIGLEWEKDQILTRLMRHGVVEINPTADEELSLSQTVKEKNDKVLRQLSDNISVTKNVLSFLGEMDTRKTGLFPQKRVVRPKHFNESLLLPTGVLGDVYQTSRLIERLNSLKTAQNRARADEEFLKPWMDYDVDLSLPGTKFTVITLGTLPANIDVNVCKTQVEQAGGVLEVVSSDAAQFYISVLSHLEDADEVSAALRDFGFTRVTHQGKGTASAQTRQLEETIQKNAAEIEELTRRLTDIAQNKEIFETVYDYLVLKQEKTRAQAKFAGTENWFMFRGWIVKDAREAVQKELEEHFTVSIEFLEPEPDEPIPILLENKPFVQPFEMITKMYSLPSRGELDPNAVMAPFFLIFFGMMLGDAGYGLILTIFSAIILKKYKFEGMADSLMRLMFLCGISTTVFGALYGSWFGNFFLILQEQTGSPIFNFARAWWFDPLDDPMRLLMFSFALGGIHIAVGLALKAYNLIKKGKVLDAVFDVGFWYVLLGGITLWLTGFSVVGQYLTIGGAVGLVLTQGRSSKNIVGKFFGGLSSLYDVTSYMSDILSYSRLLGLGLSTAVIGQVVNTMGSLGGFQFVGILMFAIVFVIGHVFNLLINTLGSYVHTSRLQYVEFFGKFYEGGGREFLPLKRETKYVTIATDDDIAGKNG